jgi:hypothetical protein
MEEKIVIIAAVNGGYIVREQDSVHVHTSLNNAMKQVKDIVKLADSTDESTKSDGKQQLNG